MAREQGGLRCDESETPRPPRRWCCCWRRARPSRSSMSRATPRRSIKRASPATGCMTASAPRSSRSRPSRTRKPSRSPPRRRAASKTVIMAAAGPADNAVCPRDGGANEPYPACFDPARFAPGRLAGEPDSLLVRRRALATITTFNAIALRLASGETADGARCGGAAAGVQRHQPRDVERRRRHGLAADRPHQRSGGASLPCGRRRCVPTRSCAPRSTPAAR